MVEKARRAAVEESRPDAEPEWVVLAREEPESQPRYVGSVRAADAEAAHEEATRLFCWYDHEVWVCPASEIRRFSADAGGVVSDEDLATPESGTEGRTHEL